MFEGAGVDSDDDFRLYYDRDAEAKRSAGSVRSSQVPRLDFSNLSPAGMGGGGGGHGRPPGAGGGHAVARPFRPTAQPGAPDPGRQPIAGPFRPICGPKPCGPQGSSTLFARWICATPEADAGAGAALRHKHEIQLSEDDCLWGKGLPRSGSGQPASRGRQPGASGMPTRPDEDFADDILIPNEGAYSATGGHRPGADGARDRSTSKRPPPRPTRRRCHRRRSGGLSTFVLPCRC